MDKASCAQGTERSGMAAAAAAAVDVSEGCSMWSGVLHFTVRTMGSLEGFAL